MYANLKVTTAKGKILAAHRVEIKGTRALIHLDAQDGAGSYAVPAGMLSIPLGELTIQANW